MKKALVLVLVLSLAVAIFAAEKKTDLETMNLNGKVKKLSEEDTIYYFNAQGNYESQSYDDYEYFGDIYYTYNDKGQITSIEDEDYYEGLVYGKYYTYNADGLLIQEDKDDWGDVETIKYEYNAKKQQTWKKNYNSSSELITATEYSYDTNGNLIKENYYDRGMQLSNWTEFSYDKAKNVTERSNYLPPKKLETKTLYKYDANHRLIEKSDYDGSTLSYKEQTSYDKYGNKIVITEFNAKTNTTKTSNYAYTYDDKGNWLSKDLLEAGKPIRLLTREIEYFED